jgi:plasmid stabilization system protein ParE
MKKVVVLKDAATDVQKARDFYENLEPGVGKYFSDYILSELQILSNTGGIHPLVFGYHRMLSAKFPYAVYYRVKQYHIEVVAVLDLRRNPTSNFTELSDR